MRPLPFQVFGKNWLAPFNVPVITIPYLQSTTQTVKALVTGRVEVFETFVSYILVEI
jgi:hypothetical protein